MKNSIDVGRHQRDTDINRLAMLAIDKGYSREKIMTEIDRIFLNISSRDKRAMLNSVVQKCYENVWESDNRQPSRNYRGLSRESGNVMEMKDMNSCFAVSLCEHLIDCVNSNTFKLTSDGCFGEDFYAYCTSGLSEKVACEEVEDDEVLVINMKQAAAMLRCAGVIVNNNGIARAADILPNKDHVYLLIFTAFWNRIKWEDIFPSIPTAARELKRTRNILIDLLMRQRGVFSMDAVAEEFFELTGFGRKNDLYLISFLDFYFFTWLRYFGLVGYSDDRDDDAVHLYLTEHGKKFLKHLQSA